jgi:phenylacetate-CoA ligase
VRDNFFDMMPVGTNLSRCIESSTSGSTDIPMKHYKGVREAVLDTAAKWYAFSECGVKLTDKFVNIIASPRSLMVPIQVHISKKINMKKIVGLLKQIKPDVIYASTSTLEDICSYDVTGISPRFIFSQAEILTERHRGLIRSAFNLETYDTYGSREFSRLAFECGEHSGLHMITDSAVMEFLDEEGEAVASGEYGEVIVTGLYSYVMPLIRYNLEDVAVPTDESCECGRSWQMIKHIIGRSKEFFTMPSGRKTDPTLFRKVIQREASKNIFTIKQFQIIQEKRNRILVKIVEGRDFDSNIIPRIKQGIEDLCYSMNEDVGVEVNIVDRILKERSGKRPEVLSLFKKHQ